VSAVREIPVATFNAVIFAFGTSAPVISVTEPAKDPVCASTFGAQHTNATTTNQIALQFFIGSPLIFLNTWMRLMNWVRHTRERPQPTSSPPINEHPRERLRARQITPSRLALPEFSSSTPKQNYCTPISLLPGILNRLFSYRIPTGLTG
jgi:hypothetical protein